MHPDVEAAQRLGDQIAELSAHIEVATARLLNLISEFDALGLELHAAYERVRVARALPSVPRIAAAIRETVNY